MTHCVSPSYHHTLFPFPPCATHLFHHDARACNNALAYSFCTTCLSNPQIPLSLVSHPSMAISLGRAAESSDPPTSPIPLPITPSKSYHYRVTSLAPHALLRSYQPTSQPLKEHLSSPPSSAPAPLSLLCSWPTTPRVVSEAGSDP